MRWRIKLAEYQYEMIYKPGVSNTNVDALSRMGRVMLNRTSTPVTQVSFDTYLKLITAKSIVNNMVIEETGDLFDAPLDYSLPHCISQDIKMSQGMALMFRRKFGNEETLRSQHPKTHEVLYIRQENRYIQYIVTKSKYWQKPSLEDIFLILQNLKFMCIELNIVKLAMPRINSGLVSRPNHDPVCIQGNRHRNSCLFSNGDKTCGNTRNHCRTSFQPLRRTSR